MKKLNAYLKQIPLVTVPYRMYSGFRYFIPGMKELLKWSFRSKELSTFTYNLTDYNLEYLLHTVSIVTNLPYDRVAGYHREICEDENLKQHVTGKIKTSRYRHIKDARCDFGSRVAWYCIIRANKPKVVVENGVEMGYTAIVLCSALLRNRAEGFPGRYYGLDFDSEAGLLISDEPYKSVAIIIAGEALESLAAFREPVDFYFSDGERTLEYETREFNLLKDKLSMSGILVSNKLQLSDAAAEFAREMKKRLIFFREEPKGHWFPGSHLGIVY